MASCKFIDEHKNIVMIGNPGRGKTHISIAIGLKACLQGYRVLFKNAGTLSTELTEARDAYQLGKIERLLDKTNLLILDELSYMSFNKYESELLFKVISDRSERPRICRSPAGQSCSRTAQWFLLWLTVLLTAPTSWT